PPDLPSTAPPTTPLHPLSLHDALPICPISARAPTDANRPPSEYAATRTAATFTPLAKAVASFEPTAYSVRRYGSSPSSPQITIRSEEHTSELQSLAYLVCRLLLEKKKA